MRDLRETIREQDYPVLAEKLYEHLLSEHSRVAGEQNSLGRWMIGSLLVINGGALIGMMQAENLALPLLKDAGPFFVVGIIAGMFCGLFSWDNAGRSKALLFGFADPAMLVDREAWPQEDNTKTFWIKLASRFSLILGLTSIAAFALGCGRLPHTLANVKSIECVTEPAVKPAPFTKLPHGK